MPSVKIRVQSVSDDELNTQKAGQEVTGSNVPTEKLAVASIFAHQALSLGKQIVSTSISNIGNFTGDYVKQDKVQHAVDIISDIGTIATGAAAGGWIGAIVATVGVITKEVINFVAESKQEDHKERSVELLRERSGNSLTNGSRTGE